MEPEIGEIVAGVDRDAVGGEEKLTGGNFAIFAAEIEAIARVFSVSVDNASDDGVDEVAVAGEFSGGRGEFVEVARYAVVDEVGGATEELGFALGADGEVREIFALLAAFLRFGNESQAGFDGVGRDAGSRQ